MSILGSIFGSGKGGSDEFKPLGMAGMMGMLSKYLMAFQGAGKDPQKVKATIGNLVTDLATEKNIKFCVDGLLTAVASLKETTGKQFMLSAEATTDSKDILIRVWERNEDQTKVSVFWEKYISQVTQADFHLLINLIFNGVQQPASQLLPGNGTATAN